MRVSVIAALPAIVVASLPGAEHTAEAEQRSQSFKNLKKIMSAMLDHLESARTFPEAASVDREGKPLLSWRVGLLPYLGETELAKKFNYREAWDSPENRKLIPLMPKIYLLPGTANEGRTHYQSFTGVGVGLPPAGEKIDLLAMTDGPDKTIALVEAANPIDWTRPDTLTFEPNIDPAKVLRISSGTFLALTFDGSVKSIPASLRAAELKALTTWAGKD